MRLRALLALLVLLPSVAACAAGPDDSAAEADPCEGEDALMECSRPTQTAEYYAEKSSMYFDTMDYTVELDAWPPYTETVARWEWPPWLKLTAYTRENIEATDTLLKLYPSVVQERDCRGFDEQPFGRCTVVFYYDDHEGQPCPVYEEFVFNEAGEISWIEAWSDQDGMRPTTPEDPWGEQGIDRLSAKIPGLGAPAGLLDLDGEAMTAAAAADDDVADFVTRANDWYATWLAEWQAAGDDYWDVGCGWTTAPE